jgi:hypothetical protein
MTGTLIVVGASIAVGDLWLIGICWRHRVVLAALLGAAGIPLVVFAIASGTTIDRPGGTLAIALALLLPGLLSDADDRTLTPPLSRVPYGSDVSAREHNPGACR